MARPQLSYRPLYSITDDETSSRAMHAHLIFPSVRIPRPNHPLTRAVVSHPETFIRKSCSSKDTECAGPFAGIARTASTGMTRFSVVVLSEVQGRG